MSPLMFSKPARRAAANAARACRAVWGRPSVFSWLSRADWTPKEMRLMPASRKAQSDASVTVSGLASSVTSAPGRETLPRSAGRHPPGPAGWGCRRRNRGCPGGAGHPAKSGAVPAAGRPRMPRGRPAGRVRNRNRSTGIWKNSRECGDKVQETRNITAFFMKRSFLCSILYFVDRGKAPEQDGRTLPWITEIITAAMRSLR